MNLYELWFIKYDRMFFNKRLDFTELRKITHNRKAELTECHQTNIQLHLYELIKFLDYFFNLENIIELVQYRIQSYIKCNHSFTEQEVLDIQKKTIQFRIIIQCEKIYCQQFWLNKKLNWDVQVRILACLSRIYLFITKVHYFLVGQNCNLWEKAKQKKLFIPIQHWEVHNNQMKNFVNQIYSKLARFDNFYYEYQYPYIKQIHEFLQNFKKLLQDFPSIQNKQVRVFLSVFQIILKENKKYIISFKNKFLKLTNTNKNKSQILKIKRNRSLQYQKKKILEINGNIILYKPFKTYSISSKFYHAPPNIQIQFKPKLYPTFINKIKKKSFNLSIQTKVHSNSEDTSIRQIIQTRQHLQSKAESIFSREKEQISPLYDPKIKAKSRRTYHQKQSSKKQIDKNIDGVLVEFDLDFMQEKQQNKRSIKIFYQQLPFPIPYNPIKINLQQQQSPSRKLKYQGVASKLKIAQKKLKQILNANKIQIKPKDTRQKKFCV